jgi:glutathione S-transferase
MITLVQFPPLFDLPSSSPFCNKVELMLKMAGIDYQVEYMTDPRGAPKGKLPFIKDGQTRVADSKLITEYLNNKGVYDLDSQLTAEQQAIATAFSFMVEESLYWALAYSRFCEPQNWSEYKIMLFGDLPPVINKIVPVVLHKKVIKDMRSQGTGLHSRDEIYLLAQKAIKALSDYLADKPYFFGEKPCSLDASAFAFIAQIINSFDSPLKDYVSEQSNLVSYVNRISEQYLSEQSAVKVA